MLNVVIVVVKHMGKAGWGWSVKADSAEGETLAMGSVASGLAAVQAAEKWVKRMQALFTPVNPTPTAE